MRMVVDLGSTMSALRAVMLQMVRVGSPDAYGLARRERYGYVSDPCPACVKAVRFDAEVALVHSDVQL